MSKSISIIIPAYNAKKTISRCLNSILSQDCPDYEVIVIDDGSTDNTVEILKRQFLDNKKIRLIEQLNLGPGVARNKGIEIAKGDFIAFMDSDDWYPSDTILKSLFSKAIENRALICGGCFSSYLLGMVKSIYKPPLNKYTFQKEGFINYKDYQFDYGYQRFIYNRHLIISNNIEFPSLKRFQDPPFFIRAMVAASKFYALPVITYCYRSKLIKSFWSEDSVKDLMKGINIELALSKKFDLPILHNRALDHYNTTYYKVIKKFILNSDNSKDFFDLLISANKLLDRKLLRQKEKPYKENIRLLIDLNLAGIGGESGT